MQTFEAKALCPVSSYNGVVVQAGTIPAYPAGPRKGPRVPMVPRREYTILTPEKAETPGQKMVALFLPLYVAAKRKEAVAVDILDGIAAEWADNGQVNTSVDNLMVSLQEQFAPLGMQIQRDFSAYRLKLPEQLFITDVFLRLALLEGAHIKIQGGVTENSWVRQKNIVGIYFGSQAVGLDIARMYGFSNRERPRQLVEQGVRNLWKNSSPDLQTVFPWEELKDSLGKPLSIAKRKQMSLAHGGNSVAIGEQIEAGKTAAEIKSVAGLTTVQLVGARNRLRQWGLELPYFSPGVVENPKLLVALQAEEDMEKLQELLGKVSYYLYQRHIQGESPVFLTVSKLARKAGFYTLKSGVGDFIQALRLANIPVGKIDSHFKSGRIYCNFILNRHRELAAQALLDSPMLKQYLDRIYSKQIQKS